MKKIAVILLAVCLCAPVGWAAYVDYQGAGGSLNVAGNWYVITDPNNPASRTGETRLPTYGDDAFIRNTTTDTVAGTLTTIRLEVGSPQITGVPSQGPTTVYVPSGATITAVRRIGQDFSEPYVAVGGYYPATMNITGGNVLVNGAVTPFVSVGSVPDLEDPEAARTVGVGVLNMTGGSIDITSNAAEFDVGGHSGATGTFNMSGGSVRVNRYRGPDRSVRIGGRGGNGTMNLSGGTFTDNATIDLGVELNDPNVPAYGLLNQTGGVYQASYRLIIGENYGKGHYRLLGGTLQGVGPDETAHIWMGRFRSDEQVPGTYTSTGKMTFNQTGVLHLNSMWMGVGGGAGEPDHSQLELKLNSANPFQIHWDETCEWYGLLEVSLTDGYTPAPGTEWKVYDYDLAHRGHSTTLAFSVITPGFRIVDRPATKSVYLICDALRHGGDANNDGAVNVGDLGILAGNWQQYDMFGKSWEEGDFTGDDVVNVGDLGVLAGAWGWTGTPVPGAPVPEPASLMLLALGGLALRRRAKPSLRA